MIEQIVDGADAAAEGAARASEASRGTQFSHAVEEARSTQQKPAAKPHDDPSHESWLGGLWNDAVLDVGSAYHATVGAVHTAGSTADHLAGKAIDAGTSAVRTVAGNGVANVMHDGAEVMRNDVKQAVGFDVGVTEGAVEAVGGMAQGIGDLAGDGYKFATDGAFRSQVTHSAETVATQVAQNPVGTAKALGTAAIHAGKNWLHGAATAAGNGDLGEYLGKGVGNVAVNIGGFFIPGADVADAANMAGKLGEAGEALGDAGKLADGGEALGDAGKLGKAAETVDDAGATAKGAETTEEPVKIKLHGVEHTIPDWHMHEISYTKRTDAAREALRDAFPPVRRSFVKDLAENHAAELSDAGMSKGDIAMMAKGRIPEGYQVHHVLPLDDGGTNATDNLVLIRNEPDHQLVTRYQLDQTKAMSPGETRRMAWPMPDHPVSVWPETPDGGAHPTAH